MLFAVIFKDCPGQGELRSAHLQAHITWVAAHADTVRVAGSLRAEPDQTPQGGLWIVEAESKEQLHRLMHTDPFWVCGLREGVQVLHWSKALDRQARV